MAELPAGYTLDQPDDANPPPAGFVVDQPEDANPPPEGFTVDPVDDGQLSILDQFLENTSVGRVMSAFGEGARDAFGADRLGLSPESEQWFRDTGIFQRDAEDGGVFWAFKAFNEGLVKPAAVALDTLMRGTEAAATGAAVAVGQTAEELGETPAMASRLTRDTLMAAETLGIVSGTVPVAGVRLPGRKPPRAAAGLPEEAAGVVPEAPVRPADLFDRTETPAVDKAGNINLDRIAAPEDVKSVIREAALAGDEFTDARRGTISLAETEELADALGMTPAQLTKRNIGQAFNAEEITAARTLLVQSASNVRDLAKKAAGGSDQDLLTFQEAMTKHMAIQEQVAGLTAEAGRALSSFRIMAQATGEAQDLSRIIEQFGGRKTIEDVARMIDGLDTPGQISKFMMDARKATTGDMIMEAWINGLLSGPQTHVTNVLSNSLIALWTVPETALAGVISKVRRADDGVLLGEAPQRLFGAMQGSVEGVRAGWHAFRTEIPTDPLTKLEQARQKSIPSAKFQFGGREIEVGGKQVRVPGRLLMGEDEFFKAIGMRQELNAQAYRIASREGLKGRAFAARMAELVDNPTKPMLEAARTASEYQTFTKSLGETGQAIQKFANSHPLAKLVLPFIRTPVNIVKYAGERTPLSVFSKEVRKNLSGANGAVARDTQMARLAMGTAVGVTGISLASQGLITGGGPKDPKQRAVMYLTGWQPYSVRVGDFYYSYARMEPMGTLLGVSADMYEIGAAMNDPEGEDLAALVMGSVSKNLVSKTWLQGPSDLIEAVQDPDRYGQRYVQKLVGSFIPTGVAHIARVDDPYLREARSILDTMRSRAPGLSVGLPPKRDIWGEPIQLSGSLGPDMVSPIYLSRVNNDPVNQELIRLHFFPAKLDRDIRGVELTAEQYDEYQRVSGRLTKRTLDALVKTPDWGQLPEFVRRETIEKTVTRTREQARRYMLMTHPDIINTATLDRINQIQGQ